MTKVVVKAEVEDIERWKTGFATHADLFKRQEDSCYYGQVRIIGAACFETNDLDAFMEILQSPDTAAAMSHDGIIDGTVEVILDSILET